MEGQAKKPAASLGKFLLRDRAISAEQLAAALRHQVIYGGRLGTNLLELDYVDHDRLATALSQLHGVPAALIRHLRGADARAATLIGPRLCVELVCLPLAFATAGGRRLVVCMRDPHASEALAALRVASAMDVVSAVCPERTIYRLLAHAYGAELPARMSTPTTQPAQPLPASASGQWGAIVHRDLRDAPQLIDESQPMPMLDLVDLDHSSARRDPSQIVSDAPLSLSALADKLRQKRASEVPVELIDPAPAPQRPPRRRAASSLSEALLEAAAQQRIEEVLSVPVEAGPEPVDLVAALEQVEGASDRTAVSNAVIGYLKSHFDGGLILVVTGDIGYGYRGFGGHFGDDSVESIVVPLTGLSPFQVAFRDQRRYVGAGGGGGRSLFGRFLRLFPLEARPEICVVEPVTIAERVVSLVYAHSILEESLDDNALDDLTELVGAMSAAFHRLIRAQRRD